MPETIEVPILDLAILIMAIDDHQLDSLTPREEGALENLRDRLARSSRLRPRHERG